MQDTWKVLVCISEVPVWHSAMCKPFPSTGYMQETVVSLCWERSFSWKPRVALSLTRGAGSCSDQVLVHATSSGWWNISEDQVFHFQEVRALPSAPAPGMPVIPWLPSPINVTGTTSFPFMEQQLS